MRNVRFVLMFLAVLTAGLAPAAAQQAPPRAIVNVTGQLYRAQNNNHYTVFLVTPEGIIMSDPINRDFARWLKAEMATRFKVPVRYVLYTHRDWDHASGGVVFADTAEFVGHRNMLTALAPPAGNPPLTADAVKMDANRNGLVEKSEAAAALADRFAMFDYNRDEVISGAEIATRFRVPVRYVLYTHRDWDHASGGVVFADSAEFVGHRNMLAALAPPAGNPPLPADAVQIDANKNGLVERS